MCFVGFRLSNKNFNSVMQRYTNEGGGVEFEDFLMCVARLNLCFGIVLNTNTVYNLDIILCICHI